MMTKRALLIGIDDYQGKIGKLLGCNRDVDRMGKLLKSSYGFQEVKTLCDKKATKSAIKDGVRNLIKESKPSDVALIHFSGHGTRWENKRKHNSQTEAIITYNDSSNPVDFLIVDEWWQAMLNTFVTDNVSIIFDCCHAGDMDRGPHSSIRFDNLELTSGQIEEIEKDLSSQLQEIEHDMAKQTRQSPDHHGDRRHQSVGGGIVSCDRRYVLLAACRAEQTAKEYTNGLNKNGVLTHFLCEILEELAKGDKDKLTWRDAFEPLKVSIAEYITRTNNTRQVPMLQGLGSWQLFGNELILFENYFELVTDERNAENAILRGGFLHGVVVGDHWRIHDSTAKKFDSHLAIAEFETKQVYPAHSDVTIKPGWNQSLKQGTTYRAVRLAQERQHGKVEIVGSNDISLREAVEALPIGLPPGYHIIKVDKRLSVVPPSVIGYSCDKDDFYYFIDNVKKLAAYLHLLNYPRMYVATSWEELIESEHFEVFFHFDGKKQVSVMNSDKPIEIMEEVETFYVEWKNKHKSADYYVTLLEFDCDLAIRQLHPPAGEDHLLKAGSCQFYGRDGRVKMQIPSNETTNQVTWRFIVTDEPVDFKSICHSGLSRREGSVAERGGVTAKPKPPPLKVHISDVQIVIKR